jgi:DNA-binding GntR family transcriptional regulator
MASRIVFRSKNEQIYDLLKAKILHGEFAPGEALVIDTLAEELGVSQIPIREALRQLEATGFVQIAPYVGARTTELQASSMREIFALLETTEIVSGREACTLMTDADINEVERMVQAMADMLDDPDAWSEHNKQLHQYICQKAKMDIVGKVLMLALDHWDRLRRYYLDDVFAQRMNVRQIEHEKLLVALRQRDPDELERIMRNHNRESVQSYLAHLERSNALEKS